MGTPHSPPPPLLKRIPLFLLHQWFLIGIGIACILAYFFPSVAKPHGTIRAEYSILYGAIAVIFLISGLSIPRQKLLTHLLNWRLHVLVQVVSFLLIPAVVLAVVEIVLAGDSAGKIDRALLAGYVLVGCIPTTIASNVMMTREAGGDDAAALVEVVVANFLGPFITAAWTVELLPRMEAFEPWRDRAGDLSSMYRDVFRQLGLAVLVPLVVGQLVRWMWTERVAGFMQRWKIGKVGTACMLLLIWTAFSSCFATGALQSLSTPSILFTVFFNIALYVTLTATCFLLCRPPLPLCKMTSFTVRNRKFAPIQRLPPEETIAVCFCGPAKSNALGIPLLYAMWAPLDVFLKAKTSVPVILYTTEQICVAHFFVFLFRRWGRGVKQMEEEEGGESLEGGSHRRVEEGVNGMEEARMDEKGARGEAVR